MAEALREAEAALLAGEVPVGAVLVDRRGAILSRAHNRSIGDNDPTAHAEVLALREAAQALGNYRVTGATLYVTVEPCVMCVGAMIWARIARLVYGAPDAKGGAAGSLYQVLNDQRLNHRVEVIAGVKANSCRDLMQRFFAEARAGKTPHSM